MTPRLLNAIAAAIGAALGYLLVDELDRRRAERKSLTVADQKWMAATHVKPGDPTPEADRLAALSDHELIEEAARKARRG